MGVRAKLVKFLGIGGHKGERRNGTEQLLFVANRVRQLHQRSHRQQAELECPGMKLV